MRNWQVTGLLNWEDKNGDGLIQYYNDKAEPGEALAKVIADQNLQGNELPVVNNDIMVLANPEIANLPGWVIGIVAAGALRPRCRRRRACCWRSRVRCRTI